MDHFISISFFLNFELAPNQVASYPEKVNYDKLLFFSNRSWYQKITRAQFRKLSWKFKGVVPGQASLMPFEKLSLKNQVRRTGFLVYFELEFYYLCSLQKSISKLILVGCTGSKNPVRKRLKIQFVEFDFSKLIFQKSSTDQQGV